MKKILVLALCIIMVTACGKTKTSSKTMEIKLYGNGTTGYIWNYVIENNDVILLSEENFESENKDEQVVGAGGNYIYTFKGQKEGTSKITFTYQRPWEEEILYDITYEVEVDSSNKITLKNLTGNYDKDLPQPIFK